MYMRVGRIGWFLGAILWALLLRVGRSESPPNATVTPELEKLDSWVGSWRTTSKFRRGPDAAVFESTNTENVRWSESREFLVTEQRGRALDGPISRILITSWNPADRQIHVVEIRPGGQVIDSTLWFEGNIQKGLGYRRLDERLVRVELTVEHTSPDQFVFRYDCLDDEKAWICCEGVSKRSK
jgi:hypothetical protein